MKTRKPLPCGRGSVEECRGAVRKCRGSLRRGWGSVRNGWGAVRGAVSLLAAVALQAANVNTFSIVGYDPVNGDWGVAVASRYFSVGAVVPWAEAGVGAIATQADVNVGYGPRGLELLRQGLSAKEVLAKLQAEDTFPDKEGRQVAIIDGKGQYRHVHRSERAQIDRKSTRL